jgi:hypothetical protein
MMGYDGRRRGRTAVLTLLYGMACDTSMGGFRARTMPFAQLGGKIAWILQIRARLRAHTNIAGASEAVRARSRWPCRHCHGAKSHGPLPSSGDGRRRGWTAVWALLYEMACDTRMGVFQRKLCGSRAKGGKIASIITAGVPGFHCSFLPGMPFLSDPGESDIDMFQNFDADTSLVRFRSGLPGCSPPCTDRTGTPQCAPFCRRCEGPEASGRRIERNRVQRARHGF